MFSLTREKLNFRTKFQFKAKWVSKLLLRNLIPVAKFYFLSFQRWIISSNSLNFLCWLLLILLKILFHLLAIRAFNFFQKPLCQSSFLVLGLLNSWHVDKVSYSQALPYLTFYLSLQLNILLFRQYLPFFHILLKVILSLDQTTWLLCQILLINLYSFLILYQEFLILTYKVLKNF